MKRYIKSSVSAKVHGRPRSRNVFDITLDSLNGYDSTADIWDDIYRSTKPIAPNPDNLYSFNTDYYLHVSPELIKQGIDTFGDRFIDFLDGFKNQSDFEDAVELGFTLYGTGLRRPNRRYRELEQLFKEYMQLLDLPGLTVQLGSSFIAVKYSLDSSKYATTSPEMQYNWNAVVDFIQSIPAAHVNGTSFDEEGGYAYVEIKNVDPNAVTHGSVPRFKQVPFKFDEVSYKVTFVTRPIYHSRLSFQHVENTGEMYMKPSMNFTTDNTDVNIFFDNIYSKLSNMQFASWDDLFDYLDSMPYISNGALITSQTVLKIVQTQNGKSRTIYSRELPTSNTLVYKDTDAAFEDKYAPL